MWQKPLSSSTWVNLISSGGGGGGGGGGGRPTESFESFAVASHSTQLNPISGLEQQIQVARSSWNGSWIKDCASAVRASVRSKIRRRVTSGQLGWLTRQLGHDAVSDDARRNVTHDADVNHLSRRQVLEQVHYMYYLRSVTISKWRNGRSLAFVKLMCACAETNRQYLSDQRAYADISDG